MPRPKKCRRICALPQFFRFGPLETHEPQEPVVMTLDEYEAIRLIDLLGFTQEDCAGQMGVARTTVQAVYDTARQKLADALVHGRPLHIQGGGYTVCPHSAGCPGKNCRRQDCPERRCACGECQLKSNGGCSHENCGHI